MRPIFTLMFLLLFGGLAGAQTVKGVLQDAGDKSPMARATVTLMKSDSSATSFETVSDNKGAFQFTNVPQGEYLLLVSSIGYDQLKKEVKVITGTNDLGDLEMSKSAETLSTVVVSGAPPPVRLKGDTAEFSANQYKVNPDANTEDLIKKMPGITVDKKGTITAQGETVRKVTVDGRDFFGDDATATLRNLPSEIVDKIQVFDKLSDQSQLTGFDDGNTTKSINIVTKPNMRQGNFGRLFAGYGTDDRYIGGGNISFFNNARRISIVGLTNNVNQQNFSSEDLLGATGGSRGGRGGGSFGGGPDFYIGQQNGISKTNSLGINFSDAWGKKVDVSASYFFNNSNLNNDQLINRQNFISKDTTQFYDENTISHNENFNHRINIRLNYKIDSTNTLIVTSNASLQANNGTNNVSGLITNQFAAQPLSQTEYDNQSDRNGFNIRNGLVYRHAFNKKGRSISIGFNTSFNRNDGTNYLNALNSYYKSILITDTSRQFTDQKSNTNQYSFNLAYTEPLGEKTQLQINYNPSFQKSHADKETFDYDNGSGKYALLDTLLSNKFDNDYNTHNAGLTIRRGDRNNMISAGVSYQYSELNSVQVFPHSLQLSHSYSNVLGNLFSRFKLSNNSNLRLMYRGSVSAPSVTQLQNVINTSNQLFYSTGNPDLQQQYTHRLMARYSYSNRMTSQSFFANVFVSGINNYISNATFTAIADSVLSDGIILHRGSQISKPVNLDGYVNARSFFTYSMPLKFIKSNLNLNAGFGYARQPGLVNNNKNISNNYNYSFGAVIGSNINEYIDFDLSYSGNSNKVQNSIRPELNQNYFTQSLGITFNLLSKKGTFFQNNLSNESYSGLTDGYNQSYWLWNMAVGQKFLKDQRGEVKLSVFDLLKQNKSITRDVTESYVQDVKNEVLQQYFMLTFTYKIKNFGKPLSGQQNNRQWMNSGPPRNL